MSALLTNATEAGPGAGVEHTGEALVVVRGPFDGALVELEVALSDDPEAYVYMGGDAEPEGAWATFRRPSSAIVAITGTYWLRAVVRQPGPLTSITVETSQ